MNIKYALSLLFSILFFASCGSSKKGVTSSSKSAIHFEQSEMLMPILERAKAENKLVFVDIYTTWCLPCKLMDQDVFTNQQIGNYFNEHFISLKVDAEKGNGANLAAIFEANTYPTLLFLDANGRVLERKSGAAYHTELKAMAANALSVADTAGR